MADSQQLTANGFPARPPQSDAAQLAEWTYFVQHAKYFTTPDPECGSTAHSNLTSGNWAGHVVPQSDYNNADFIEASAVWIQPEVYGDPSYPNWQSAPDASFWAGLGFTDIMQAGVDSIASNTPMYKFWTEDYPQNTIWEGPSVSPGDQVSIVVTYLGSNQTHYVLENVTTGETQSFINSTPYVGYKDVDFINERPGDAYLPDYFNPSTNASETSMTGIFFSDTNNNIYSLTTANNRYTMTSNCLASGLILAYPGPVAQSGFPLYWQRSQPFTQGCSH